MAAFSSFALAAVAGATILNTVSSIKQGQAANKTAKAQATFEEQDGVRARQIAEAEERDFRRRASSILATRRAGAGAQGVTSDGTPALVDESVVAEAELQALRIRTGGQTDEARARQQAALTRQGGKNAQTAGYIRGGASLLQGIGSFYDVGAQAGRWGTA
jgi:hypothetical protein